jgi:integrase/recombinase XerD
MLPPPQNRAYLFPRTRLSSRIRSSRCAGSPAYRVSPHWLRHAHATHALAAGAPLNLVKDTLGHSSIAITDMYLHVAPEHSSAQYIAA